jgi:AcrR family transcriptional regulator
MSDPVTTPSPLPDLPPTDGRLARAARSRAAIVDALLDLVQEGDLQPTANRIATRAGISLRLIYHHFGDLESLYHAAAARQAARLADRIEPIDPGLPVAARVAAIVRQRAEVLDWMTPVRLASLLQEPYSQELRSARDELTRAGEAQLADLFSPELDRLDGAERDETLAALTTVLGWGMWNDLRTAGRSPAEARAVLHRTVAALVGLGDT